MIKLTKNLVTIVSSLSTRYSIKKVIMQTFALMWHSPSPCSQTFLFWWIPLPPKCERNNWMPLYGFNKEIIRLFLSYLKNHTQRIKIRSTFSDWTNIVKGIPHSSIVGPLLFNIFINDLFFFSTKCEICYFADDSSLYSCGMNLDNIFINLIQDM